MNTAIEIQPATLNHRQPSSPGTLPPAPTPAGAAALSSGEVHWSWACRRVKAMPSLPPGNSEPARPHPGDLALVRVETGGFHKQLTTADNRRMRLHPGALFVGVFGNRYASDAYEAEVQGPDNLSLLTAAGMIGTVISKNDTIAEPTRISFVGFVPGPDGSRLNLKERLFRPATARRAPRNLVYVVGSGMNTGKTTTDARLIKGLSDLGLNVAACKLTGSVSNHDPDELASAAARQVIDFSDFGFPSTYLCSKEELLELFHAMMAEVASGDPDVALMELADGLLQRETAMLLADPTIQRAARGVVFTAESSLSALWGANRLRKLGYRVIAVSGMFTSSPLAIREYCEHCPEEPKAPVVSSAGAGADP